MPHAELAFLDGNPIMELITLISRGSSCTIIAAMAGLLPLHAAAQENATNVQNEAENQDEIRKASDTTPSALGVRQQRVERMMNDLEQKFINLSQKLKASEPERADRLIETLQEAKQLLIQKRMGDISDLLGRTNLEAATAEQQRVIQDLRLLIRMLLDDSLDDQKRRQEEKERLERWKKEIQAIIREELPQERESQKLSDLDGTLQTLEEKIAAVEQLIERQVAVNQQTEEAKGRGLQAVDQAANSQHEVRQQTEAVERSLADPQSSGPQSGDPQSGDPQSGDPQSGDPQSGDPQSSQSPPRPKEPGQQKLQEASRNQRDAEQRLSGGEAEEAKENQQQALNALNEAVEELKKERERIANLPPEATEALAEEQIETRDRTAQLDDQMKNAPSASPTEAGESSSSQPSPGQSQIAKAQQQMQNAANRLQNQDAEGANREQNEAIKNLNDALEEIEDRLSQLKEETQEEKLARLEARFTEMLARQQVVSAQTLELDEKQIATGTLRRSDRLALAKLASEENALAEMSQEAYDLLVEDGTSVVFPRIVEDLKTDLQQCADGLKKQRTDSLTQLVQSEVETTLEELISALQRAQKEKQENDEGGGSSGGGGGGNQPLLPPSAELKALRSAQMRVNRRTKQVDQLREVITTDPQIRAEIQNLFGRQAKIVEMTDEMIEKMRQGQ
ncbi:MAG: hypothetical protein VX739_13045 [Planctomycetota bacterium]|nr:hypothetical protein [Planctomycetota bacterium]